MNPRPEAQTRSQQHTATPHSRLAQARRHDRPNSSGRAAATRRPQPRTPLPTGPVWKRSTSASREPPDDARGTPNSAVRERSTSKDQGNRRTMATTVAPTDAASARSPATGRPASTDPTARPMPITGTTISMAGAKAAATAASRPSPMTRAGRRGRRGERYVAAQAAQPAEEPGSGGVGDQAGPATPGQGVEGHRRHGIRHQNGRAGQRGPEGLGGAVGAQRADNQRPEDQQFLQQPETAQQHGSAQAQ